MNKVISHVYQFTNGMVMTFDQHGQQMPEFQGEAEKVIPKIREAGYTKEINTYTWRASQ